MIYKKGVRFEKILLGGAAKKNRNHVLLEEEKKLRTLLGRVFFCKFDLYVEC